MGDGIGLAANGLQQDSFTDAATNFLEYVNSDREASPQYVFPHVRITEAAFPAETELALARAREFISTIEDPSIHTMLNLACMSVLESVSFTRKDGQYLRWDPRSRKQVRTRKQKKSILQFKSAIGDRLAEMCEDIEVLKQRYGKGCP